MLVVGTLVGAAPVAAEEGVGFRGPRPPALAAWGRGPTGPSLRLVWLDLSGLSPGVEAIARKEVSSLMERMGTALVWRRGQVAESAREGEIRVVLVDRLLVDPTTRRPILGATAVERRAYPVVWVHLAGVRATLGQSRRSAGAMIPLRDRRDIGLAVGRVVAHEVVHVVAPALSHGRGLMSQAFTRRALTAPQMSFEPGLAVVVRASLRGAPVPVVAPPGTRAASGMMSEAAPGEPAGIADSQGRDAGAR
jgi:hypothetical protein